MKKLIGTMPACVMILSLAGCGKSRSDRSLTAETDTVLTTAVVGNPARVVKMLEAERFS